nr:YigZ family protein [Prevotella sp.]
YYGGVNLGTGGLIVAYRTAAADAIANSEIIDKIVEATIQYTFTYPMMNDVMRIVKEQNARIIKQEFDNTCSITLAIRESEADILKARLTKLSFE